MTGNITIATDATFKEIVEDSTIPVLIDFWAPWCGPCMALLPALEALAPTYEGQLKIVKINADENPKLVETFGVRGIPQMFWIENGKSTGVIKGRTRTQLAVEIDSKLN